MNLKEITAKDIMSTDVTVIKRMEKVTAAEMMMIKRNIGGLPVVSDSDKLIGTINENLPSIIKKMNDNNIERIPIVNGNDHVVGIVVTKDIIKALGEFFKKS